MKNPFKKTQTPLEKEIETLSLELQNMTLDDPNYKKTLEALRKLLEIHYIAATARKPISRETILIVCASLGEVALMLFWEQGHALASKAMSRMIRPKL